MKVVLVESPSKAKTINKYLGSDYRVVASYGHVRDLPSKNGSVDPDQGFQMIWESDAKAQKHINEIIKAPIGAVITMLKTARLRTFIKNYPYKLSKSLNDS